MTFERISDPQDGRRVAHHQCPRLATEPFEVVDAAQVRTDAGERHAALCAFAIGTGLRQGEILELRWADVDDPLRRNSRRPLVDP